MSTATLAVPRIDLDGINEFVHNTFQRVYEEGGLKEVETKPIICQPEDLNWSALADDIDSSKFGEYTLNPDVLPLQWGSLSVNKFKMLDFKVMIGMPLSDVVEQAIVLYGGSYNIPGVECQRYFVKNLDRAFDILKDGRCFFFVGSVIRNRYGHATAPYSSWVGGLLRSDWYGLCLKWNDGSRIVLVEK